MTISKGYTFGATELVTNAKLHTLVDSATLDGLIPSVTATSFCLAQASKSATAAAANHSAFILDHYFSLDINGLTLFIPCATATA